MRVNLKVDNGLRHSRKDNGVESKTLNTHSFFTHHQLVDGVSDSLLSVVNLIPDYCLLITLCQPISLN